VGSAVENGKEAVSWTGSTNKRHHRPRCWQVQQYGHSVRGNGDAVDAGSKGVGGRLQPHVR
jgi:hypothetical protein